MAVCCLALLPAPLLAQGDLSLVQADAAFEIAQREYDNVRLAAEYQAEIYLDALTAVQIADESGDEEEYRQAQARFLRESQELRRRETRIASLRDDLDTARENLLAALDLRMNGLEASFATASLQDRQRIQASIQDMENQYRQLQREGEEFEEPDTYLSSLRLGPRAGALEIRTVMEIAERRAQDAQESIDRLEREIQRLEGRLRRQRGARDFSASLDLFDATRLPTGLDRQEAQRPVGVAADSTAAQPLTLEEQIEAWRDAQEQLGDFRDDMLRLAEEYRRRLEVIGVEPLAILGRSA
jgi:hypothetical protein